jgi:DNA-binding GntR family transcriptional regulator
MRQRASEMIAERLRKMVITEELTPGTIISEAQLCEMLGCTRTPLRSALQQLSHHHLVEIPPRRGVVIPQLSVVDYQQLSEAQLWVGTGLMDLVAERIDDEELARLGELISEQERSGEERDYYALATLDSLFHTSIIEATGNRYFTDFSTRLQSSLARFLCRAYRASGNAALSITEHKQIVEALRGRDAELARSRMREHVSEASKRVLTIIGLGEYSQGA